MSVTGWSLRRHWLEVAWVLFTLANLALMFAYPRWETVPFHFVWVSLTLLYGLHVWRVGTTAAVLVVIMAATGAIIIRDAVLFEENLDEITEVPLMSAMFVAMVWHARRHRAAVAMVQRLADREHRMRTADKVFVRNA